MRRGLKSFLKEDCHVPERRVPYYLKWIAEFSSFCRENGRQDSDGIIRFIENLTGRFPDRLVSQAKHAVTLYRAFRGGRAPGSDAREPQPQPRSAVPDNWPELRRELTRQLRLRHRSYTTEKSYKGELKRFAAYLEGKAPPDVTQKDLEDYLSYLAVEKGVSASTQQVTYYALVFAFRYALGKEVQGLSAIGSPRRPCRLPVMLSRSEVAEILGRMKGVHRLMVELMYGSGLRLTECLSLRIKDIDFERNIITVRSGKGNRDRETLLPENLKGRLREHLEDTRKLYDQDRYDGVEGVWLPDAMDRANPHLGKEWGWFWVFPSRRFSIDPLSRVVRRHHIYRSTLRRAYRKAVLASGIIKPATLHSMRHSFASHLLENGYDIRTVQELMGHASVETTMIYTHVARKKKLGITSPMDEMALQDDGSVS